MEMIDWALWALLETAKYMILTYAILGFKPREGKWKYLVFLYVVIGVPINYCLNQGGLLYRSLWGMLIIAVLFDETWGKKTQAYFLIYMLIAAMELLGRSILAAVLGMEIVEESNTLRWINEVCAVATWVAIACMIRKHRKAVGNGFRELPFRYFVLIFLVLVGVVTATTLAWGITQDAYLDEGKQLMFSCFVLVMFVIMILLGIFIYHWQKKKELEVVTELTQRCYDYQKNYYEGIIRKDEELRRFRHDIRKHMGAIAVLCEEGKTEKVQNYIRELQGEFEELTVCRTGNAIADYFINQTLEEMRACGNLDYTVIGRFPAELRLTESDLCILLGNAMDNAKEALLKCEGERKLSIEIKSYKDKLYLTIANTTSDSELDLMTSKPDKENHGYGIKNMERVTEKYGGKIEYTLDNGMFALQIEV